MLINQDICLYQIQVQGLLELLLQSGFNERLVVKIYEVDSLVCPKCGSEMRVLSIITDGYEIKKILKHLIKTGKSPLGVDESLL